LSEFSEFDQTRSQPRESKHGRQTLRRFRLRTNGQLIDVSLALQNNRFDSCPRGFERLRNESQLYGTDNHRAGWRIRRRLIHLQPLG
jgi:hypothetical protein